MGGSSGGSNPLVQSAAISAISPEAAVANLAAHAGGLGGLQGMAGKIGNEVSSAFGAGYDKPQMANIQQAVTPEQMQQAQGGVNNSLQSQQNLLSALQGQNGLGQQSSMANQLQAANGIGTQNAAIQGLQGTAGQYQNIAAGRGPNPAQAMLNQQTGANVANQNALMAGQRGAGANVGLMARQAAQQGAATQQQAVGQGATMQANQQLNALSGLANTQQAFGNMGTTQAGMQQGMANQMAGQQIGQTQANTQANLQNTGQLQGALGAQNNANVSSQNSVNAGNAALLQTGMQGKQGLMGGAAQGLGAVFGLAGGGVVHHYDVGGAVNSGTAPIAVPVVQAPVATPAAAPVAAPVGAQSSFGKFLNGTGEGMMPSSQSSGAAALQKGIASIGQGIGKRIKSNKQNAEWDKEDEADLSNKFDNSAEYADDKMAKGGLVPAMLSEKEVVVPPQDTSSPEKAAQFVKKEMAAGGGIKANNPSQKANVKGNSYANDKIPKKLPEGSVVIPRDVMESKNPIKGSADFVAKVLAKRRSK